MTNTLSDYSTGLILLSYLVSVLGSLAALYVATNIRQEDGKSHLGWLAVGALMLGGCAIWSMHFIGMVAYDPGVPMAFDTVITGISLIVPIAFTYIGLIIAFRSADRIAVIILAGLIMGLGVASMHYTGMAAMSIEPATVDVDFFTQALPRDTMLFFTLLAFLITCFAGFGLGAFRRMQAA